MDRDSLLELAAQDDEGTVQTFVDIHRLDGRLIQVGIALERLDEFGDAPGALANLLQEAVDDVGISSANRSRPRIGMSVKLATSVCQLARGRSRG